MIDFTDLGKQIDSLFTTELVKSDLRKDWRKISLDDKLELLKECGILDNHDLVEFIYSKVPDKEEFAAKVKKYSEFPYKAIWKSNDHDIPVTVTGIMGNLNGVIYYSVKESNAGIPENELAKVN